MTLLADYHQPLSEVLQEVADLPSERITVAELVERFGGRAMGALLLVFGLLCLLPLPPGGTTIFGLPLLLLAPQLVIGRHAPWLPQRLRLRQVPLDDMRARLPRLIRWLRRIEAISQPRLTFLFGPVGERLIGVVCTALALVLILPIWGGNMLPALAVSALSLALILKDGVLALAGYALVAVSGAVLALAASVIVAMLEHAWAVVSGA
ncbi:exopolysaccharide biosynthesis protein [Phenylobacterium sp.]|uniref:exopolysaccharide biosynthesis protein n=1 Tax=Phenylobacterium sp. TaxID=1871053 RepID=UPI0039194D40